LSLRAVNAASSMLMLLSVLVIQRDH